jgi:hypothetical protein
MEATRGPLSQPTRFQPHRHLWQCLKERQCPPLLAHGSILFDQALQVLSFAALTGNTTEFSRCRNNFLNVGEGIEQPPNSYRPAFVQHFQGTGIRFVWKPPVGSGLGGSQPRSSIGADHLSATQRIVQCWGVQFIGPRPTQPLNIASEKRISPPHSLL